MMVKHHHERYDGRGYPSALKGEEISIESSILALADVYDAITSKRSYKDPMTYKEAKTEILRNAGTQFNPDLTPKFIEVMDLNEKVFNRDVSWGICSFYISRANIKRKI